MEVLKCSKSAIYKCWCSHVLYAFLMTSKNNHWVLLDGYNRILWSERKTVMMQLRNIRSPSSRSIAG